MTLQKVRKNPIALAVAGVALLIALAFAWWTISPLFIRTTLVEGQNIPIQPTPGTSASNSTNMEATATYLPAATEDMGSMEGTATPEPGGEGMMAEASPTIKAAMEAEPSMQPTMAPTMAATIAPMEPTPMMAEPTEVMAAPAGPMVLGVGTFDRKDDAHYANGQAILARDEAGNNIVRLQDLNAGNGPDLYVYVTEHPDPQNSEQLSMGGYNLGTLKATNGSFSYTLDPMIDPSRIKSVVIYCKAFSVIFSTATLEQ